MLNQFIRILCTDPLGNIAFVVQRPSGTWRCELLLGTPCSFIFCGVASADAADLIFALEACSTAQHVLETVRAYSRSPRSWGYELLADPETPTHRLSEELQTVCSPTDLGHQVETLRSALSLCVEAIDNLLPGAKYIVADVGLVNEALIAARQLCKDGEPASVEGPSAKGELIRTMLSMLRDLHENFGWDELSSTLEDVEEAARALGIEES